MYEFPFSLASGWYVYIESSGRSPYDAANMASPMISTASPHCLRFWYHMYGTSINTLSVYSDRSDDSSTGPVGSPIWSHYGNQTNEWLRGTVTEFEPETFQVRINVNYICGALSRYP